MAADCIVTGRTTTPAGTWNARRPAGRLAREARRHRGLPARAARGAGRRGPHRDAHRRPGRTPRRAARRPAPVRCSRPRWPPTRTRPSRGAVARTELLTVIDYSRPSTEPRLWVLDLEAGRVLYRELVAHGQNSGHNLTERFSNAEGSHMTSLGLFVTADPYVGRNGYSLRLHGLDRGVNDNAFDRAIVVHGAPYVSRDTARKLGRLGRSHGCPAVRAEVARALIDTISGGSVIFAYGPSARIAAARPDWPGRRMATSARGESAPRRRRQS